jgi:hypothetical protein
MWRSPPAALFIPSAFRDRIGTNAFVRPAERRDAYPPSSPLCTKKHLARFARKPGRWRPGLHDLLSAAVPRLTRRRVSY